MGCVGLTGEGWSDFFLQCKREFHYERIYYDAEFFSNMMEKLNLFYFCYYLPALVASKIVNPIAIKIQWMVVTTC